MHRLPAAAVTAPELPVSSEPDCAALPDLLVCRIEHDDVADRSFSDFRPSTAFRLRFRRSPLTSALMPASSANATD
ncbi:hypothetical protein GC176_09325 [bacterium]|nr:hypothetical protein [bacterium]